MRKNNNYGAKTQERGHNTGLKVAVGIVAIVIVGLILAFALYLPTRNNTPMEELPDWMDDVVKGAAIQTGTVSNPIMITTELQLMNIGNETYSESNNLGKMYLKTGYYKLAQDVTISSAAGKTWLPYCNATSNGAYGPFMGVLDGNNYKINITGDLPADNAASCFGIIGVAGSGALIKDVTVNIAPGATFGTNKNYTGGLIGYTASGVFLTNVHMTGTGTVSGGAYTGGLIGFVSPTTHLVGLTSTVNVKGSGDCTGGLIARATEHQTVRWCWATGNVSGTNYVGGFVGYKDRMGWSDNYATGNVTATGAYAGGYAGRTGGNDSRTYATGNVTGGTSYHGGYAGYWTSGSSINACYATGNVSGGTDHQGGFIGYITFGDPHTISNSYASGNVSGTNNIGGFIGGRANAYATTIRNSLDTFNDCVSYGDVSGTYNIGGFFGYALGVVFNRCVSYGNVTASACDSTQGVGGFIGISVNATPFDRTFASCFALGQSVIFTGNTANANVGGFVGLVADDATLTINGSTNADQKSEEYYNSSGVAAYRQFNSYTARLNFTNCSAMAVLVSISNAAAATTAKVGAFFGRVGEMNVGVVSQFRYNEDMLYNGGAIPEMGPYDKSNIVVTTQMYSGGSPGVPSTLLPTAVTVNRYRNQLGIGQYTGGADGATTVGTASLLSAVTSLTAAEVQAVLFAGNGNWQTGTVKGETRVKINDSVFTSTFTGAGGLGVHMVSTEEQFLGMAGGGTFGEEVYGAGDVYFIINDITIGAEGEDTTITGTTQTALSGIIDGGGFTITFLGNITKTGVYVGGIINQATTSATIRNIVMDVPVDTVLNFSATSYAGGIVGYGYTDKIFMNKVTGRGKLIGGGAYTGGLAGFFGAGSYNTCTIDVDGGNSTSGTGGLAGVMQNHIDGTTTLSSYSWASGDVTAKTHAAGFVSNIGNNQRWRYPVITYCAAFGNVTAETFAGGFFVISDWQSNINNSFSLGDVTITKNGGTEITANANGQVAPSTANTTPHAVAGAFGVTRYTQPLVVGETITNNGTYTACYAKGSVTSTATTGTVYLGGLLAFTQIYDDKAVYYAGTNRSQDVTFNQ